MTGIPDKMGSVKKILCVGHHGGCDDEYPEAVCAVWEIDGGLSTKEDDGFDALWWDVIDSVPIATVYRNLWWIFSENRLTHNAIVFLRHGSAAETIRSLIRTLPFWVVVSETATMTMCRMIQTNVPVKKTAIVSAIYDIRQMENPDGDTKKINEYLDHGEWFACLPDVPLVVFTSQSLAQKVSVVLQKRPLHNTHIIVREFADTLYYQYRHDIEERQKTYIIRNRHPDKDTPLYIVLMCNKMYFLEEAMRMEVLGSTTHWAWIDFGIRHVAHHVEQIRSWIHLVPDRIRMMAVTPWDRMYPPRGVPRSVHDRSMHTFWYHFIAGGLFTGSTAHIRWLIGKYEELFRRILIVDQYYQNDQVILAMLARDYPEFFCFYFGDYAAIIENYWFPCEHAWIIEFHARRYLEEDRKNPMMDRLLHYIKPFYSVHPDHQKFLLRTFASYSPPPPPEPEVDPEVEFRRKILGDKIVSLTHFVKDDLVEYMGRTVLPLWVASGATSPLVISRGDTSSQFRVQWLHKTILLCLQT